jgi:KDO2-lipid IV(A) lauroyltransferase
LPDDSGYIVSFTAPLAPFPSDDVETDVTRLNGLVEATVRLYPDQYWWIHRRFKTRPPGGASIYNEASLLRAVHRRRQRSDTSVP